MVNAQEWLDQMYPKDGVCKRRWFFFFKDSNFGKSRAEIINLDIQFQKLEGSLSLEGFVNLKELNCFENQLTEIDIRVCSNLKKFECPDNLLTNLNLSQNNRLKELNINNNNFAKQDLSFLSHLTNLRRLFLANLDEERIQKNVYNRFMGSLEPLKGLDKLEWLNIENTDLSSGLEHLPDSLGWFWCSASKREDAKVQNICNIFANEQGKVETDYLLQNRIKDLPEKLRDYKKYLKGVQKVFKNELQIKDQQLQELQEELVIEQDHAKNMDNWYRNLLGQEKKTRELVEKERDKLKEEVKQLQKKLNSLQIRENFQEQSSHQAQIQIPPKQ